MAKKKREAGFKKNRLFRSIFERLLVPWTSIVFLVFFGSVDRRRMRISWFPNLLISDVGGSRHVNERSRKDATNPSCTESVSMDTAMYSMIRREKK